MIQPIRRQHRALEWLHLYGRRYPWAWEDHARMLYEPPPGIEWPSWCWLPMTATAAILMQRGVPETRASLETGPLAALAAWRATQGIYRVHPTLLRELLETPVSGDLPADVLTRLPEWCVYVETPGHVANGIELAGFFAHCEWDVLHARPELRLVLDMREPRELVGHAVHLGGTIEAGILAAIEVSVDDYKAMGMPLRGIRQVRENALQSLVPAIGSLVSVLLYLCADDAEIEERRPLPPKVVRGKKRPIMPAAREPVIHPAGYRIGAALDLARERFRYEGAADATGATVTPHVRRAHWHRYWTGPRDGERRIELRWLSPILVNAEAPAHATVREVKV